MDKIKNSFVLLVAVVVFIAASMVQLTRGQHQQEALGKDSAATSKDFAQQTAHLASKEDKPEERILRLPLNKKMQSSNDLLALVKAETALLALRSKKQRNQSADPGTTNDRRANDDALGGFFGQWTLDIAFGSSSRKHQVTVDTGSSNLVIIEAGCISYDPASGETTSCLGPDRGYDPSGSVSAVNITTLHASQAWDQSACITNASLYEQACVRLGVKKGNCCNQVGYGDGTGALYYLVKDIAKIGALKASTVYIGAVYLEVTGFSQSFTDGIAGFGYKSLSSEVPTIIDQIIRENNLADMFAIYGGTTSGELTIGGVDPKYYTGDFVYTRVVEESYYVVKLNSISINGEEIPVADTVQTIVDSGTNFMVVPADVRLRMEDAIQEWCNAPESNAAAVSAYCGPEGLISGKLLQLERNQRDLIHELPDITLYFADNKLVAPATSYVVQMEEQGTVHAMWGLSNITIPGQMIISGLFMDAFYTVFDRAQKRVGFAPKAKGVEPSNSDGGSIDSNNDGSLPVSATWGIAVGAVLVAVCLAMVLFCGIGICLAIKFRPWLQDKAARHGLGFQAVSTELPEEEAMIGFE